MYQPTVIVTRLNAHLHEAPAESAPLPVRNTGRPAEGIGSATSNTEFLAWLETHSPEMIPRGCSLCRDHGHPFTTACLP